MIKWILLLPITIAWYNLDSQNRKIPTPDVTDLPEELLDESTGQDSYDLDLVYQPQVVNLNKCTEKDLVRFPWLTPLQVKSFIQYRTAYGPFVSTYELQAIPGWDVTAARLTEPWVLVRALSTEHDPRSITEQLKYDGGLEVMIRSKRRIELPLGYRNQHRSTYQGSPWYWLIGTRYRKKGKIDLGLRAEKDGGERFHWNPKNGTYGPDHLSMFLVLENLGRIKKLILGDFRVQWDQGLIMGSGFSFRKLVITGPRKVHQGFLPHSSTQEFGFFRGLGVELVVGKMTISSMYSFRLLDANLRKSNSSDTIFMSSIIETGLHRTNTEIERKNRVGQQVFGIHLSQSLFRSLIIKITGMQELLQYPLHPTKSSHNQYYFTGDHNFNLGASLQYDWKNINMTSQLAISKSGGVGAIISLIASLAPEVSMILHLRNYDRDFHGIASKSFGTNSNNINEQGAYWGLQVAPSKNLVLGYYCNLYRHLKPTFRSDATSTGKDQLFRLQFTPRKKATVDFHWRGTNKLINHKASAFKLTNEIKPWIKHSFGLRVKWHSNDRLTWTGRYQYSFVSIGEELGNGMLISNQLTFSIDPLRITGNVTLFKTDDFDNRQYIYEKDLPHSYSMPFFEGVGLRWYLMTQLRFIRHVDFWVRVAQSKYDDRLMVGSGNEIITGSKRTDLSVQIRYKI